MLLLGFVLVKKKNFCLDVDTLCGTCALKEQCDCKLMCVTYLFNEPEMFALEGNRRGAVF